MQTIYFLFKFLHVAAAGIWVGGVVTFAALNARLARTTETKAVIASALQTQQVGKWLLMPAAVLTLVAGGVAMGVSGLAFTLWVGWGLVAIALAIVLGATAVRRSLAALMARLSTGAGDVQTMVLQRRIAILNATLAAILLSATWAMVFKPTL